MYLDIMGAYGREVKLDDWNDGKDFRHANPFLQGTYLSNRDVGELKKLGYTGVAFVNKEGRRVLSLTFEEMENAK